MATRTKHTAHFTLDVTFDPRKTDAESLASALDRLMETALSTPDLLHEYGNPKIGKFYVSRPIRR